MSVACADIYAAARAFSPRTPTVIPERYDILQRIRTDQQVLFTSLAGLTRDRFKTTTTLTSTTGATRRTFDLSAVSPSVERILSVTLADGREAYQVDELDPDAELAPRYIVRGQTLVEVGNDWNTASTAAVTATLSYVYGPTDISPTGAWTQTVTVPDQWVDLLVLPLALYLLNVDPVPSPAEEARVRALLEERQQAFATHLGQYGGLAATRFAIPTPQQKGDKP